MSDKVEGIDYAAVLAKAEASAPKVAPETVTANLPYGYGRDSELIWGVAARVLAQNPDMVIGHNGVEDGKNAAFTALFLTNRAAEPSQRERANRRRGRSAQVTGAPKVFQVYYDNSGKPNGRTLWSGLTPIPADEITAQDKAAGKLLAHSLKQLPLTDKEVAALVKIAHPEEAKPE